MWNLLILLSMLVLVPQDEDAISFAFTKNKGKLISPLKKGKLVHEPNSKYSKGDESFKVRIAGEPNSKVVAVFKGEVYNITESKPGLMTVMVKHGNFITFYANLSAVNVTVGNSVKKATVLGSIRGNSDGQAILVFSMRKQGQNLNPRNWLKIH